MTVSWQTNARGSAVFDFINALRSELRPFDYMFHEQVLNTAGLYSFWLRKMCLYVGMSMDLRRRIEEHSRSEPNIRFRGYINHYPNEIMISIVYLNYDESMLRKLETKAIRQLHPITNNTTNMTGCT